MELDMEMLFLSVLLLFVTLTYVFLLFNTSSNSVTNNAGKPTDVSLHRQLPLPPGSSGWPIIGEGLSFMMASKRRVPEKFIGDRKIKYSSPEVFTTSLLRETVAVLCSAAGNKFMFSNENKLVHSWWPENIYTIFAGAGRPEDHEDSMRLRRVLSPFFSPNCLRKYVGIMDAFTKKHMQAFWLGQQQVKVLALAKKHTFELVCKIFLNVEDQEVIAKLEEPIQHIAAGFISLPINLPGTSLNRAVKASKKARRDLEEMVQNRTVELDRLRKSGATNEDLNESSDCQDLMSKLLIDACSNGRKMKESDIADIANKLNGLLIAAYDNVFITICSIVMYLSELPTIYDGVLKEQMEIAKSKSEGELLNWGDIQKMKYTWNVICEVLRLEPPNPGTFREAMSDIVYDGYLIPKGMKLYWSVFSTHKNSEYFPDPKKFDPSRFEGAGPAPYSYVPFGGGPRMCPGREYARLTMLIFMHNMVTRFKWEKIYPEEKMVMTHFLFFLLKDFRFAFILTTDQAMSYVRLCMQCIWGDQVWEIEHMQLGIFVRHLCRLVMTLCMANSISVARQLLMNVYA